jgi:hypothetical protein
MEDASNNPAVIARDLLQKFGAHTYDEFDLSWMDTARQLSVYRARLSLNSKSQMIKEINKLLGQYNTAFFLRFNKYALMYLHWDNFRTNGKTTNEKDIKLDSFKPGKEMNQYFNSANANYDYTPFTGKTSSSDTYVSTAGVSFAGKEYAKTLELPSVYRGQDLDRIVPLHVRLSAPEPEFIDVTFGFRLIRTQMQDFLSLTFDDDIKTNLNQISGRRFQNVPCMVRKMSFDLKSMTVTMKLWSLGNTAFGDYVPPGASVGGENDKILLTSLGRQGRISPTGYITGSTAADRVTLALHSGDDAETRANGSLKAWEVGYKVDLVDAATGETAQTLTVSDVSGSVVIFEETIAASVAATTFDTNGFPATGHFLRYANYSSQTEAQRGEFASFCRPSDNYPTSRTQELEEQRGGAHNFDDGGLPYILYPIGFNSSL